VSDNENVLNLIKIIFSMANFSELSSA